MRFLKFFTVLLLSFAVFSCDLLESATSADELITSETTWLGELS